MRLVLIRIKNLTGTINKTVVENCHHKTKTYIIMIRKEKIKIAKKIALFLLGSELFYAFGYTKFGKNVKKLPKNLEVKK